MTHPTFDVSNKRQGKRGISQRWQTALRSGTCRVAIVAMAVTFGCSSDKDDKKEPSGTSSAAGAPNQNPDLGASGALSVAGSVGNGVIDVAGAAPVATTTPTAAAGRASGTGGGAPVLPQGGALSSRGGATAVGGATPVPTGTLTGVGGIGGAGGSVLAGAAGALAAAKAGFPDMTKPECVSCLEWCNDPEHGTFRTMETDPLILPPCEGVTGFAADGPGAGAPRKQLCEALLACVSRTRCALTPNMPDPLPVFAEKDEWFGKYLFNANDPACPEAGCFNPPWCYCGRNAAEGECIAGKSVDGPCKSEIEAAFETTESVEIVQNFFAIAVAANKPLILTQCAGEYCLSECFTR